MRRPNYQTLKVQCNQRNISIPSGKGAAAKMALLIADHDQQNENSPSTTNPGVSAASVDAKGAIARPPNGK
jgi:hypothetical protein